MSTFPSVSGKEVVRALKQLGFNLDRIEGSHHIMVKDRHPRSVPVPVHGSKPLPKGTLASVLRMAGITRRDFLNATLLASGGLLVTSASPAQLLAQAAANSAANSSTDD